MSPVGGSSKKLVEEVKEDSIEGDDENDSNGENQSWSVATGTKRKTTKKSFKIKCKKIFLTDDQ